MNNSTVTARPKAEKLKATGGRILANLQKVGKSLVFPIAVLPAAAILNRLGGLIAGYGAIDGAGFEQFTYWIGKMVETPGAVVFNNLAAVFAIGVAFGFAKDKRGEAALIGFISYLALNTLVSVEQTSMANLIYQNAMLNDASGMSDLLYLTVTNPNDPTAVLSTTWTTNLGVFGGIVAGLFTAFFYNRYSDIRLPKALGFFSGRRFVPMVSLLAMVPVALVFGIVWPWIQFGLTKMGQGMQTMPEAGAGVYAFVNRLLIPFGLHQVLNTFFWFQMPVVGESQEILRLVAESGITVDWTNPSADLIAFLESINVTFSGLDGSAPLFLVQGDINAHAKGVEGSGAFQTGFFPVMMFGLPAMGMAMAKNADKAHKKAVWAFMLSAGAVSFITGITEPLEFAFAFTSPLLYGLYSLISGFVAAATVATGAMSGFGFSAGLIDLMISMPIAAQVSTGVSSFANGYGHLLWILGLGVASMPVYYFLADITIRKADLATPGRKGNIAGLTNDDEEEATGSNGAVAAKWTKMAEQTIDLVGKDNLVNIDNCITRVRLTVKDNSHIKRGMEASIGYTGYVSTGKTQAHFIIGAESEIVANEMRRLIKEGYGDADKSGVTSVEAQAIADSQSDKLAIKDAEIAKLKKQLASTKQSDKLAIREAEISELKKQLESTTQSDKSAIKDEEIASLKKQLATTKKAVTEKENNTVDKKALPTRAHLRKWTVVALKSEAKKLGVKGYSKLKKEELIDILFKAYRK